MVDLFFCFGVTFSLFDAPTIKMGVHLPQTLLYGKCLPDQRDEPLAKRDTIEGVLGS